MGRQKPVMQTRAGVSVQEQSCCAFYLVYRTLTFPMPQHVPSSGQNLCCSNSPWAGAAQDTSFASLPCCSVPHLGAVTKNEHKKGSPDSLVSLTCLTGWLMNSQGQHTLSLTQFCSPGANAIPSLHSAELGFALCCFWHAFFPFCFPGLSSSSILSAQSPHCRRVTWLIERGWNGP